VTQPAFCPRCRQQKASGLLQITHAQRGVVFNGCPDCIIGELDDLARRRDKQCFVCGATKVKTLFAGVGERLECPVHVGARPLLGRALKILRSTQGHPQQVEIERLCMDLVDALKIQEE